MSPSIPSPSLEPTLYFLSNSLTVIAAAGFVFFMLGLWFGYLTWGRYKRRARAYQEETNLLRLEIARLKRRLADDVIAPAPAPVEKAESVAVLAAPEPVVVPETAAKVEATVCSAEPELIVAPVSLRALIHTVPESAPVIGTPHTLPNLELVAKQASEAVPSSPVISEPAPPVEVTLPVVQMTAPSAPAPPPVIVSEAVSQPAPESMPTPVVAAPAPTISELAGRAFASELAIGTVRCDSSLGVLYAERPDRWDDLTLMRGVAEITQQKLHDFGIYTFKQIAVWDDRTMREVGHATHMGDRIVRDRWAQQARDLHYLKYGEKLG